MGELLVIVSEKNDIVYQRVYSRESEEEYCRLIILIYGSVDVLVEKMASKRSSYFDCLDMHGNVRISAYIMPSGYKLLFAHSRRDVRLFLGDVHRVFAAVLVSSPLEEGVRDDQALDDGIDEAHKARFGPCRTESKIPILEAQK